MNQDQKPRRLTNLRIDEVSVVDRGAGKGVRIVLRKSDHEGRNPMIENPVTVAKALHADVSNGKISEFTFACHQQEFAKAMFPNDAPYVALAKFLESPAGLETLRPREKQSAEENTSLMKAEYTRPKAKTAKPSTDEDGDGDPSDTDRDDKREVEEPFDRRMKKLADKGFTYDQAASEIHRQEKVAKGFDW